MKRFLLIFALLFQTLCGNAVADSSYYDYFNGMGVAGRLPAQSAQTAFLGFDSTLGTATFVRNGGAVNPDTGLWANENLLLQSQTFGTTWALVSGTSGALTENQLTAPDGTTTADKLYETASNTTTTLIRQTLASMAVSTVHTYSVYVHPGNATWVYLQARGNAATVFSAWFNVATGAKGTANVAPVSYSITPAAGGFYRIDITYDSGTGASAIIFDIAIDSGDGLKTVNASKDKYIYIWGAQLQRGSTAGLYLATTTAAKYDQPRFVTGKDGTAAHALFVEESSTNLVLNSENFADTSWSKVDTTITTLNAIDAGGGHYLSLLTAGSAGTDSLAVNTPGITVSASTTVAVSTYLKRGNSDWVRLVYEDSVAAHGVNGWFNLATGEKGTLSAYGSGTAVSHSIESKGNGIYRCTIVGIASTSTNVRMRTASASANGNVTRVSGATCYQGLFQLTTTPYATSYIPTTTAAATRVAEYAPQATSGLITQDAASTVQGWWKPEGVSAGKTQTIWSTYTGGADYTRIEYSGTQLIFTKAKTGQATETIAYGVTITPGTWYHAAVTIAADGTALMYHNGALVGTNGTTTAFKPVIAINMQYGAFNGTLQINGALDNFRFFNRVLTANEILTYVNKGK